MALRYLKDHLIEVVSQQTTGYVALFSKCTDGAKYNPPPSIDEKNCAQEFPFIVSNIRWTRKEFQILLYVAQNLIEFMR